ncbi:MAG: DMT family transporter [Planctomycetes bacterium]|nr:DMT family transporter [Planctomycetota bacterium]
MPTTPHLPPRLLPRLQVFAAALLFSTGGTAIKATQLTAGQIASFRAGIAALALPLLLPAARRGWTRRTATVAVAYAAMVTLFVASNKLTTAANAIFLQSTSPFYLLLLGPWLLREPIRRRDLGFLAAVAGGLLLFFVGSERPVATAPDPLRGNALALLSGLAWALTVIGLRWVERAEGGGAEGAGIAAVAAGNVIAFLAGLPWALPVAAAAPRDWAVLVYLGVVQIGIAYACLTSALRRLPALEVSSLLLLEPAISPVWAWLALGEVPGAWSLAGGALIVGAALARTLADARAAQPAPAAPLPAAGRDFVALPAPAVLLPGPVAPASPTTSAGSSSVEGA